MIFNNSTRIIILIVIMTTVINAMSIIAGCIIQTHASTLDDAERSRFLESTRVWLGDNGITGFIHRITTGVICGLALYCVFIYLPMWSMSARRWSSLQWMRTNNALNRVDVQTALSMVRS